jgi:hypothetical protein
MSARGTGRTTEPAPAGFTALGRPDLRRAGLAGDRVAVLLGRGNLTLTGETGVPVVWPLAGIARIRVGYAEGNASKHFQTLIWRIGEPRPIRLCPDRAELPSYPAYTATIRKLAADLTALHGPGRVERGEGAVAALFPLLPIALIALAACAIALFVIANEPWWGRLILGTVASAILGLVGWDYLANKRPMPVKDLAELDRQLPK